MKMQKYSVIHLHSTILAGSGDFIRPHQAPFMEFHISRQARLTYQFDESLFQISGNVVLANFHAARIFAQRMNDKRDIISFPEKAVRAGQVNAMGLIDEILHYVVYLYRTEKKKDVLKEAEKFLAETLGEEDLRAALKLFVEEFPPLAVFSDEISAEKYLDAETEGIPNTNLVLEELIMLWIANMNPALSAFNELFDDEQMEKRTQYKKLISHLHEFFNKQPLFGPDNENLIDMLRSPAVAEPYSLTGQLDYIRRKWGIILGSYFYRLLRGLDFVQEEERERTFVSGAAQVYEFKKLEGEPEPERFSPDQEWMPRVVLLAKSTYVWLDQLSKKYKRSIHRLDQIPDEELDQLARWGFTGLWLIGLWERSKASQRIKQLCGNPEAVASAYSLMNYNVAADLGGEEAFMNLRDRAWQRGIRMGGDMVPNHMGIDSNWVMEHPDWFIQLDYSPFPSHTYNGENLSWDGNAGIYLEDHYYSRNDAAVVFKRVDHRSGETRYIYHGNDGTSMPWNDTAQLNYLKPEVREAVIQTILDVARKFPIIRFDAAMTLAKKHYQRLWFPEPGSGGDIPTRAEHGMTKSDFDNAIPVEFWREVVDRVAQEVPDTLLLAEAFWLMEGYFVRTLGMHRVYNSAFMNMLKNEQNDQYRSSIKNVLEFNPEILKRFVNFMNNPDEATAVAQFGKGDKYFGVCTMLVTMPGLPMLGHGQIEGFTEKYGMEYRKAYWDEQVDQDLVSRHEREIFPLMKKRYLFADVKNFYLYDFYNDDGHVNENVFAYSNSFGNEYGLVIYNNKYENASGWIKTSSAYSVQEDKGGERTLQQNQLGNAFNLHNDGRYFTIFREHNSGLEYIRNSKEIVDNGMHVSLNAFQCQVFMEFRELEDNQWNHYSSLAAYLNGRGVPSIEEALRQTFLRPVHHSFREIANPGAFRYILASKFTAPTDTVPEKLHEEFENKYRNLLDEIRKFTSGKGDTEKEVIRMADGLEYLLSMHMLDRRVKCNQAQKAQEALKRISKHFSRKDRNWFTLLSWYFIHRLGSAASTDTVPEQSRAGLDEWLLTKIVEEVLYSVDMTPGEANRILVLVKILTSHQNWWEVQEPLKLDAVTVMQNLLRHSEVQDYLQINRYRDVLWFNHESFVDLMNWLTGVAVLDVLRDGAQEKKEMCRTISERFSVIKDLLNAEKKSGYQVEKLINLLKS